MQLQLITIPHRECSKHSRKMTGVKKISACTLSNSSIRFMYLRRNPHPDRAASCKCKHEHDYYKSPLRSNQCEDKTSPSAMQNPQSLFIWGKKRKEPIMNLLALVLGAESRCSHVLTCNWFTLSLHWTCGTTTAGDKNVHSRNTLLTFSTMPHHGHGHMIVHSDNDDSDQSHCVVSHAVF